MIALLLGHIFHATVNRIAKVEDDFHKMMELKKLAEAAGVAKSQVTDTLTCTDSYFSNSKFAFASKNEKKIKNKSKYQSDCLIFIFLLIRYFMLPLIQCETSTVPCYCFTRDQNSNEWCSR